VHDEHSRARAAWPELPFLLAIVLAVVMTWPLVLHLGSKIGVDVYDPLYSTWQLGWIGHALLHAPLHLYQANIGWPAKDTGAFTDLELGYAPAALVAAQGPHAALVVYNLLHIFTFVLAFLGAYLLARELGAGRAGGLAAGAAFAYSPWRLAHTGHFSIISNGGIPLALYLLVRGYRRRSARTILAGWLVAAWQMSLGFAIGIQFAYLLLILAVIVAILWLRRGRPRLPRAVVVSSAAGACLYLAATALLAMPYLRVLHEYPESKKTVAEVAFFSPPPSGFLSAPAASFVWGGPTAQWRNSLRYPVEQTMFPGVTTVVLALLGLASAAYSSRLRVGLAAGTVICGVLSLGLPSYAHPQQGFTPYRFLYEFAPGWEGGRTPGRINLLTSLGLALLAGAGLALVLRHIRGLAVFRRPSRRAVASLVTTVVLGGAILLEGFGQVPLPRVPAVPPGQVGAPAPQLHLPFIPGLFDEIYAYWSTDGFPAIVNSAGSFTPTLLTEVRDVATSFPDAASVAYLRRLGIRSVILHRELAYGTSWQNTADRSIAGLGITRQDEGNLAVYRLAPSSTGG
jgi:hypothetical protein